ncbi:ABC transporter substrate-binding protein [Dactylosporangium fulvum]|uniref:ABC transporter substrate-binding protein n=1 Tax=Dactylosporangium fulvum TaxID=53359 RepID=A0ABY5W871_9ACTN|nr:ABC transporter substrate-binding protein [Dactylosporangium fulvum]UWP85560.1 ABC transporter substrate-binding protein [Dactylosporangium fulvum]
MIAIAIGAALTLSGSACGGSSSSNPTGKAGAYKDGQTLTLRLSGVPGTLDPTQALGQAQVIDRFAYDPLINIAKDGSIVSGIAEKWTATPAVITFTLRPDVTCSDGHKLVASDVQAYFEHLQDPKTAPPALLGYLADGKFKASSDDAARTFTVTFDKPFSFGLPVMASIGIVCPSGLADLTKLATTTAGTGPFVLKGSIPDVEYRMEARTDYAWGPGGAKTAVAGFPAALTLKVVPESSTAINMGLRGELDMISLGTPDRARLMSNAEFAATDVNVLSQYLFFNQHPGLVFEDSAVRKALSISLDRDKWGKIITGGFYKLSNSTITGVPPFCQDPESQKSIPTGSVDAANKLLDDAGWARGAEGVRGKDGKKLEVKIIALGREKTAWEYAQQEWAKLGVKATIEVKTNSAANDIMFSGSGWDLRLIGVGTNLPSQWTFLLDNPDPKPLAGIKNAGYSKHAAEAIGTPGKEGCQLWDQAAVEVLTAVNIYPLIRETTHWFARKRIEFDYIDEVLLEPSSLRVKG